MERRRAQRAEALRERASFRRIARQTRRARKRVKTWPLSSCGKPGIAEGLRTVYRDGRRAMRIANTLPTDDALHEWRKRTKDLRYALELLQCHARDRTDAIAQRAHELTNLLGDDHDLATLRTVVKGQNVSGAYQVIALIDERRTESSTGVDCAGWDAAPRDAPPIVRCVWAALSKGSADQTYRNTRGSHHEQRSRRGRARREREQHRQRRERRDTR